MESTGDLRAFVGSPDAERFASLRDAVDARSCRERYGADTIDGLMERWGHMPTCPACGSQDCAKDGKTPQGRARWRCRSCGKRFGGLSGTIFACRRLPLWKIVRIVELMCHDAQVRLVASVCRTSAPTAFLWRHKIFSTVDGWQEHVMLGGRVWTGGMYFDDTELLRGSGREARRRLSKDKICVVVAIDACKHALAIASENGKPTTKRINAALASHIRPGPTIVHDCEKAHDALVRDLQLVDERYKADTSDPDYLEHMALVNYLCSWIRRYVSRFPAMKSGNLQTYPSWWACLFRVRQDEDRWPVEERVVRHLALSEGSYLRKRS